MRCPRCGCENRTGAKFCNECAAPLPLHCAACGAENRPGANFCDACGISLATPPPASSRQRPDGVTLAAQALAPMAYTPAHLTEKIRHATAALAGERKQVTVLFADLKGSMELLADRDPEDARQLLDPVLERLMAAVHRYEGTVNQVMGDGIMALFGAPIAHEDHAVRACYTALGMQEAMRRYSEEVRRAQGIEVQIRVGLNSGEVVVRAIASDLHMDYTAVGQTTHLAARMEQLAPPGSIRLTAETLRLAEGFVQVTALGPVPVKGLGEPVEVFELVGAGPARTRLQAASVRGLTRFVGRDAELAALHQALEQAGAGHGQVVALVGEPGVGKSRLVYECTRSHRTQGWLVLESSVVVVGEIGGGGRQEQLALGDTPNIAARLQSLAAPDTVVISAVTYELVQGYFTCHALGTPELKGVAQPLSVYQVLHASGMQTRLDVAAARGLTPLVGRDAEVALLRERWAQVIEGQGQIIVLTGEAGIGKSRLVQSLKDYGAQATHTRWECRCSPYYHNTALYPLIDLLHRALDWHQLATPAEKLATLEQALRQYRHPLAETVPLVAQMLSLALPEGRYAPLALSPQRQKQKTLETLLAMVLEVAEHQPLLLIVEDLHWVDPTTLEWLSLVVDQAPTTALCVLGTCRPEFQVPWGSRSYLTQMTLRHLARPHVEQLVVQVSGGKTLPAEVMRHLVEKTDGVPLFVEELTKTVLESGLLTAGEEQYTLAGPVSAVAIPTTLQDSLMARLDRLVTAKGVAQLGATIGRQCFYELLHAVADLWKL